MCFPTYADFSRDALKRRMDSPRLQARSGSVLRDRTNTIRTSKQAHDEKASPQAECEAHPELEAGGPPRTRERLESELYENRALLHRVLREKQQFLSRQRTQGSALERALVAQEVLIAELQELDAVSPRGEAEAEAEAEARTQPEIERRFEELHLRLQFKEAALQQQHLETRYFEQQARDMSGQACTCLHMPPYASSR